MNLQGFIDSYLNALRNAETTLRIGEALEQLEQLPKDFPIKISMEWVEPYKESFSDYRDREYAENRMHEYDNVQMYFDGTFDSDRGDYANMYLGYTETPTIFKVQDLIDLLNKAKKQGIMEGYKGGIFRINDRTLLTIARYGFSEGIRPTSFELLNDKVVMHTTYED